MTAVAPRAEETPQGVAHERQDRGWVVTHMSDGSYDVWEELRRLRRIESAVREFVEYYDGARVTSLGNGQARRSHARMREELDKIAGSS